MHSKTGLLWSLVYRHLQKKTSVTTYTSENISEVEMELTNPSIADCDEHMIIKDNGSRRG